MKNRRSKQCLFVLCLFLCLAAACGPSTPLPDQSPQAASSPTTGALPPSPTAAVVAASTPALAATAELRGATPPAAPTATRSLATEAPTVLPSSRATEPAASAGAPTSSPTRTPLPPAATATRPAPTAASGPRVTFFTVVPTTTLNLGDSLAMSWQASGQKAELCPIAGPGPVESRCREVPLQGSTQLVTDEEAMAYIAFGLRVTFGVKFTWSTASVNLQCRNLRPWFFDGAPPRCPAQAADESFAAGQYFERGIMIWVEDADDFYVFYAGEDEQGFQTFDWISQITLEPGASPDNRVGEQPPADLVEPISGFGMVWRGEIEGVRADVRERLGWATGGELGFTTAYQCVTPSHPRSWSCFLRGPRGEILHLHPDSTAQVRFLWEEW